MYRKLAAKARRRASVDDSRRDSGLLVNRSLAIETLGFESLSVDGPGPRRMDSVEREILEGQIRVLCHLCVACWRLGDADEAVGWQEEAMDLETKVFGRESDQVATSLLTIARIHNDVGKLPEALQGYETALAVLKRLHRGPKHPRVALTLNNIGVIYSKQGQSLKGDSARQLYQLALLMHEEALDIYRCTIGGETSDVADTLFNMAVCRDRMGDRLVALDNAEEAVRIYVATGAGHSVARTVQATVLVDRIQAAAGKEALMSADRGALCTVPENDIR
mmetsp:Transcript_22234/g.51680  ORF Transcript_22234/g.51680 Transcript_22234/m.51680 type:complete len:278 (+) Transcript_22234:886-1719(+)